MERLDLFDRFARVCFLMMQNGHTLISTTDAEEAVEDAERVVLQVGENCARKYLRERRRMGIANLDAEAMIEQAIEEMLGSVPREAELLSLLRSDILIPRDHYFKAQWPSEPSRAERFSLPHQVLRWIRGEEYTHELLKENERSPLKRWLDDVNALDRIVSVTRDS